MQKTRLPRLNFSQVFGIDPRSMALFRVVLALVILSDLWVRAHDLVAFYTDAGVLPRAAQIEIYSGLPALFSPHLMNDSPAAQWILFGLAAGAALALLVGYRTFWATLISWVLLVSMHNRNPMVLQGGDVVLRVLLFWSLFLPLGARFSLDPFALFPCGPNRRRTSRQTFGHDRDFSGHLAGLLHLLVRGGAQNRRFVALRRHRHRLRAFHTLGIFSWIAPIAWLLFVPTGAWDWLETRLKSSSNARLQSARAALMRAQAALLKGSGKLGLSAPAARPVVPWKRSAAQGLCALFLLYVFAWNLRTLDFNIYSRYFPAKWNWVGEATRLDQRWSMFSPYPLKDDGWFIGAALLANGQQVDLVANGTPLSWKEPENLSATFRDAVWQKYMSNLWSSDNAAHRAYYAAYLMRNWNSSHSADERVQRLQLVYMKQTNLPGFRKSLVEKVVVWKSN